jgi:hypothetical protein
MYLCLIDTVTQIVKNYGVSILSDPKFWHILTDSYSFGNEYSLRDIFKSCVATGYIARLVALRGKTKTTKDEISHIIKSENKINPGKKQEYAAVLYSVAIAIGTCSKKDYADFFNQNSPKPITPPIPNPNSGPQSNTPILDKLKVIALVFAGVIILTGSLLSYGLFFFCEASMFGLLFITGLFQIGYCKILDNFVQSKVSNQLKNRAIACIIPIIIVLILSSMIPLILCSDSISDAAYTYFSAEFIPESYYVITPERVWYAPRLSPSVGFWGGLASIALCISLVSCAYRINEHKNRQKLQFSRADKMSMAGIIATIVLIIVLISLIPAFIIMQQRSAFERIEANNKRLYQERKDVVQDLSVKGIKLGISNETAWEYMNSIKEDQEPSQLHYLETIKHPDAIYDEFIGTSYYSVFPYELPMSDFEGVSIGGEDYRMLISLDNTTVGLDIYTYDGLVTAMRIYGLGNSNNSLSNFESLLSLYTTKYGQPEIIKDFSREEDIFAIMPYRSKGKNDRYVWNFKNGRIEMSELGIMYISETLISKVRNECEKSIKELEFAKKRKTEQEKIRKEKADSLKHMQEKRDSIRRVRNHKNAINEI